MKMSATEASRGFSDLLSRVAAGESVEVERHGHVVAVVTPPPRGHLSGAVLVDALARLPVPDRSFAADVEQLSEVTVIPADAWQS